MYAVLVHAIVIAVLVVSFRWTWDSAGTPEQVIDAKVVEDPTHKKREEERARQQALEAQRRRQEEERARQQAIEDEKRQQEAAQKQRQAELARKREAERERQEAERKKQLEAEQMHQAELRREQELAERQKQAEQALQAQLAAEEEQRQEAARAARAMAEAEKYKVLIRQKVSRNWSRPPSSAGGLQCVVRVRLVPGGEVLQATVVRSSGDAPFDRSVENAVYKASPLPLPEDPELFSYFREIEFVFSPKE